MSHHPSCRFVAAITAGRITLRLAPILAFAFASVTASKPLLAQVDVMPAPASYTTLKGAFDAINVGTHTGTISISISGNTNETAPAVLNASGSGAASYTSIGIQPSGGAPRTISGAIVAGSPLIDLSGADNVTIDGLNTGGNSLTISNTTASATVGTSTIRFIGGATNNTITHATILGSSSSAAGIGGGTIFFSTDAITANGNDGNTISDSNIGPAGANLPSKAIFGNGSLSTTAIGNSGIVVHNNNIFDYFAPAVTSAGLVASAGCNTWTISNNRFYQTGTRTWTMGSRHVGINIQGTATTSGAQGFTISGNVIGYASSAQTGIYTLTGTGIGAKFQGIVFNGMPAGTTTNVTDNTVAAVNMTGVTAEGIGLATPFAGVLIQSGTTNVNNNTIGSQSATGSLQFATTTSEATDIFGIYNFFSLAWATNDNTVGGVSVENDHFGTLAVYGIRADSSTGSWSATSNSIGGNVANSIQLASTSFDSQIVGLSVSQTPAVLTSNVVRNLTNNAGTGTITAASVIGILVTAATQNHTLTQNTILALRGFSSVTGIQFTGATANVVSRNRVSGLSVTGTGVEVNGIRTAVGTTIFRNNMIAIGAGIPDAIGSVAANGSGAGINGIHSSQGNDSFLHNSVYIGGSAAAGTGASYAFNGTQVGSTRAFRDNIFYNARTNSGATGKHYAIKINGTAPNPAGLTLDNNLYFVNHSSGGVFGYFNSADVPSLGAWRVAVGQDAGSLTSDPQFVDPTNLIPDLHLHPTAATMAEGRGSDVGVLDDFDGQTRAALTPIDIGADAGSFVGLETSPPTISYTNLSNTTLTSDRTLVAAIVDETGVASGGFGPRIYYRRNAGTYFSRPCSLTGGTVGNGNWSCTIVHADLGIVIPTDVIAYFVIAQDTLGNISSNPFGAIALNVAAVSTPPPPNTYTILTAYSGSLNVGAGEGVTSLTNAAGLFERLNAGALVGDLVVNLTSDLAGELGTVSLNQIAEEGVGGYSLLIKPSGAPRSITGSNASALIRLAGSDRVRIDGSTAASFASERALPSQTAGGDPSLRQLTIRNTNAGTNAGVIALQTGSNGAQGNILRNLNLIGQNPTTTLFVVAIGGNSPGMGGADNDLNRVENCSLQRAIYGIYASGASTANPSQETVITRNEISSAIAADRIGRVGVAVFFENLISITENSIIGISTNESFDAVGIGIGLQGISATDTSSGGVTHAVVSRNRIDGVLSSNTTGYSAVGIGVAGGTSGSNIVSNNMISGVSAPSTSPDIVAGIFVAGGPGFPTRLLANSIRLSGDRGIASTPQIGSFGIAVTGLDPAVEIKNNAVSNSQISPSGGGNAKSFAIGLASSAFTNLDSDFNDLFASGANAAFFRTGGLDAAGTDLASLAAWQAAVSDDANSLAVDPLYVSASDLHLTTSSPLLNEGVALAAATVDFDGNPRPVATPDIGADEIVQADLSITKTDGVTSVVAGGSTTYTIVASNSGAHDVVGATVADSFAAVLSCSTTCVGAGGGTCTAGPFLTSIHDVVNLPVGASVTYTSVCAISGSATGTLVNTATVTSPGAPVDPSTGNNTATDSDTVASSADLSITKTDGSPSEIPGTPVTYTIVASNAGPSAVTGATVADGFPAALSGCSTTCTGAGGGTCPGGPVAGNINASVDLPAGASVTFLATCDISPGATGNLVNMAAVGSSTPDPNTANNSATDVDTLIPLADVAILKTDGATTEVVGTPVTYTITVSNAGPSNASNVTVADNFVAALTGCSTTCVASGGATCTNVAVVGNLNDTASVPVGGTATYTATCNIAPTAFGTLVNTATATVNTPATDPTPANNTSTDTDTLNQLFRDGFEIGTTANWSSTVPLSDFELYATVEVAAATTEVSVPYDFAALRSGRELGEMAIVELVSADYEPLARLMARRTHALSPLELRLEVVGGATSEWIAASAGTQSIRLDWVTANPASFGSIDAALDGVLTVWIDGFDPAAAPAKARLFRERTNR